MESTTCNRCGREKPAGGRCAPCRKDYLDAYKQKPGVKERQDAARKKYRTTAKGKKNAKKWNQKSGTKRKVRVRKKSNRHQAYRQLLARIKETSKGLKTCLYKDLHGGYTIQDTPGLITHLRTLFALTDYKVTGTSRELEGSTPIKIEGGIKTAKNTA